MIKKIVILLICCMFAEECLAKKGVNIFAYSRPAPQTGIYDSSGLSVALQDFKGQFVLLMFWSRYCAPCIRELDDINEFVKITQSNGIKVLLVSQAEEWTGVGEQKMLLKKYKAENIDFYTDRKGELASDFGIFSFPHTVLVDQYGEEIGRISGSVDWDDEDVIEYIYKLKAERIKNNE